MKATTIVTIQKTLIILGGALAVFVAGCGGGGGRGAASTAAPITSGVGAVHSGLLPLHVSRPAGVTSFSLVYAPATPTGAAVTALAPAPGGELLAALSLVGRIDRIAGAAGSTEVQLAFDVTSLAAVGSTVLAATGNEHALRGGAVYRRGPSGGWTLSRDGTRGECVVGAGLGGALAATGDGFAAEADVCALDSTSGAWSDLAAVSSLVPAALLEHRGQAWVGGRSIGADGRARLARGGALGFQPVALPLEPATGEALAVVALAEANGVLYAAVAGRDAVTGRSTRGSLLAFDDAAGRAVELATLEGDAPACMVAADGTVYLGTTGGRIVWLDEGGRLREEARLPANRGVTALLAHQGALLVGLRGVDGARLVRRGGASSSSMTITQVAPSSGPEAGGTQITITGAGFPADATVTVGGQSLVGLQVVSATQLTGRTAPHAAGPVDVVVTSPTRGTATLPAGFTYGAGGGGAVLYGRDIAPILQAGCVSCHKPGGLRPNSPLTNHAEVRMQVQVGQPSSSPLFLQVAPGGFMRGYLGQDPAAKADLIKRWIEQGALND